ncbi:MAG: NADH dehydrogenase [Syntrophorhabdaceae bacterium PtaU1.Bin034]|jgi:alkyl hydroperoxide reductase subunit F|nr:MAG: NADH dehydrogenase [Syntrophorhabdaceae bacterium PtaU1.Bin034]
MHDLMILGAGPAGMTAAVYAARQKADTLLLSKDVGGQVNWTLGIENYMGYQFIEGVELIQKFEEQVRKFPIEIRIGKDVKRLIRVRNGFEVEADGERHSARTVIVCTGKRPKTLNVPGEEKLRGRGVTYCEVCDGPLFQGMDVAVIGGGNSALEAADNLTRIANHVSLVSISPLTGDNILIEKVKESGKITVMTQHQTLEVTGDGSVSGIRIRDLASGQEKDLPVGGVFVEIGLMPNSDFVRDVLTLNELGEIQVNCACETEIAGLYAAGDVTNVPAKQIVVAAGEGAKAAIQAHQFLQKCI